MLQKFYQPVKTVAFFYFNWNPPSAAKVHNFSKEKFFRINRMAVFNRLTQYRYQLLDYWIRMLIV